METVESHTLLWELGMREIVFDVQVNGPGQLCLPIKKVDPTRAKRMVWSFGCITVSMSET
jgi:hypothetical protein